MRLHDIILVLSSGLLSHSGLAVSAQNIPLSPENITLAADPPLPPWYPLKAWEITKLHATNPDAAPYGTNATSLEITISNPSSIPAGPAPHASGGGYVVFESSTADCVVHWKEDDETPYGNTDATTCDSGSMRAQWNITINEIQDIPAHYISLSFSLAYSMQLFGNVFYKTLTGSLYAMVGETLEGGCSDGLCEYNLINGSAPLLIQPTLFECKYACG
ncbi:hypothetical protein F4821DRAFT_47235 [Hypoxylon rubiginosum]|uniref:Uncharacterized protein n=1 Tax=Hypoxylon rubiginosum TaxID=110542 RepID=A0ACC0CK89_9PEZI|nr:hypothetical protein F4821DRAFT_47235 [Hypoxylon rubiginosum]